MNIGRIVYEETATINEREFWVKLLNDIVNWIATDGVRLIIGFIAFYIGCKIVNFIARRVEKKLTKRHVDKTAISVTRSIIRKGGKIALFVAFLGYVGIDTAGIGALLASIGVGIGLAIQGSLANFAGGIVIVVMRPFRLGDYIEAQGEGGTVEEIKLFYTYIITNDNRVVMIPNGILANGTIRNFSMKDKRRVDLKFYVSYDTDIDLVKRTISDETLKNEKVLSDPSFAICVDECQNSSICYALRVWVKKEDYWDVYNGLTEDMQKRFISEDIVVPYQQLDVHIDNKGE